MTSSLSIFKSHLSTQRDRRTLTSAQQSSSFPPLFAGGFGSSSTTKKGRKKRQKKSLMDLDEIPKPKAELSTSTATNENQQDGKSPVLDRFGLPIQTAENLFPPLPPETELLPVKNPKGLTDPEQIQNALKDHLKMNFSFIDKSNEKNVSNDKMRVILLHESPPVLSIENFFTKNECEEYINLTKPQQGSNEQNLEVQSATFSPLAQSKRTSTTWFCHYNQVPALLTKVKHLLSFHSRSTLDVKQMEEPQVVRYRTGEEFSWHYDEIPSHQLRKEVSGGQRIATLLVYLNTVKPSRGGGTVFRDLVQPGGSYDSISIKEDERLTMRPKTGSALLFFPAKADGTPDDRTLHKGEIMKMSSHSYEDEKMIAQIWIHESEYFPQVPPGNTHEAAMDSILKKEKELGLDK